MLFFKQKTAYEMRISDWSSDVCSSDLHQLEPRRDELRAEPGVRRDRLAAPPSEKQIAQDEQHRTVAEQFGRPPDGAECIRQISAFRHRRPAQPSLRAKRSNPGRFTHRKTEERGVGKECISKCRSRWSPYN